ncbi:MAG: carbamoyltransferase family protein [Burkholderiales bacterium]
MDIIGISGFDNAVRFKQSRFPALEPRAYRIAQGFDSAAVLVRDGQVDVAVAEERLTREKATGAFPVRSIRCCLEHARLDPRDLAYVAHGFDYAPHRTMFEEEQFYRDQFSEVYDSRLQIQLLEQHFPGVDWKSKFVAVPHHLAHAASAFYQSGFDEALVVVSDGMGEVDSMTVYAVIDNKFDLQVKVPAFHSLGVLYSVFTLYFGFAFNMDEYKVMGLAPYGDRRKYFNRVMDLVRLRDDGTYAIPLFGKNTTIAEKETHGGALATLTELFGPPRAPDGEMDQRFKDLAAAVQAVLQTVQLHVLKHFAGKTGFKDLCMAGGVALNCTNNGVVRRSRLFRRVFVQPAAGDDGSALGAALYVQHSRDAKTPAPRIAAPLWGPFYGRTDIQKVLSARKDVQAVAYDSFPALAAAVAERLANGHIIGWFQGRMEFGPRALGSRSIVADPRPSDMRERVNMLIKKREGFRPFAPAVAAERASEYFELDPGDEETYAHMLFVVPVRSAYRDKLPAVTHIDGTARVQTVTKAANERFYALLNAFAAKSGMPILLNTSFNVKGQPIVCTPAEAIDTFLAAGLDAMVLGDFIVTARGAGGADS